MRCGKSESEVGALVHLPPNMDICPSCLETEVNQMSQMFGFTVPGQPSQSSSQPSSDSGAQGGEIEEVTGEAVDKDGAPADDNDGPNDGNVWNPFGNIGFFTGSGGGPFGMGGNVERKKRDPNEPIMAPVPIT